MNIDMNSLNKTSFCGLRLTYTTISFFFPSAFHSRHHRHRFETCLPLWNVALRRDGECHWSVWLSASLWLVRLDWGRFASIGRRSATPPRDWPTQQLLSRHDELKERARQLLEATKREAREKEKNRRQSSKESDDGSNTEVLNGLRNGEMSPSKKVRWQSGIIQKLLYMYIQCSFLLMFFKSFHKISL